MTDGAAVRRFFLIYAVALLAVAMLRHARGDVLDTWTHGAVFIGCVGWLAYMLQRDGRRRPPPARDILQAWLAVTGFEVLVQVLRTTSLLQQGLPNPGGALLFAAATAVVLHSACAYLVLKHGPQIFARRRSE